MRRNFDSNSTKSLQNDRLDAYRLSAVGKFVSQAAIVSALLYYFGWAEAQAALDYFGVDSSFAGLGTSDYVLRSTKPIFGPLVLILWISFTAGLVHRRIIVPALETEVARRRCIVVVRSVQLLTYILFSLVVIGLVLQWSIMYALNAILPLVLVVALLTYLYLYCDQIMAKLLIKDFPRTEWLVVTLASWQRVAVYMLVVAGLFWALGLYAARLGIEAASSIATDPKIESEVVLYSSQQLALTGPGVAVTSEASAESKYHYRYHGLRLLFKSSSRYILLPENWHKGEDYVLVVPDDNNVRVDIKGPN